MNTNVNSRHKKRTYSRKRPECQVLDNVRELCRLCLTKSECVVPIFDDNSDNQYTSLALRIMICIGIEVTREESLPNIICKDCFQKLQQYSAFRKKCEISYLQLKSHLEAIKQNSLSVMKKEPDEKNVANDINITFETDGTAEVSLVDNNKADNNIETNVKTEVSVQNDILGQSVEIKVQSDEKSSPDISAFLSMVLLELGILSQHDNKLAIVDSNLSTLTLDTGDDALTLKLVEEDEEEENIQIFYEEPSDNEDDTVSTDANKQIGDLMQYVDEYKTTEHNAPVAADVTATKRAGKHWCGTCGASFRSRSVLARHGLRHSGLRPHACDLCPRRFAQRGVMLRHRLVHQEERPFKCQWCPKSFTQRAALGAHGRAHAAPRRSLALHRCPRCPKVFLYASGLSRHMMWHNGRAFMCPQCNRLSADRSSMLRHLKTTGHGTDLKNLVTCQLSTT